MRVLVLGGGVFVGRHLVEAALRRGWAVTVLTRGRRPLPDFASEVSHVVGDRRKDINDLHGTWDVVIDTCGYRPEDVALSVERLGSRTGVYVFVSSASVYSNTNAVGREDDELQPPPRTGDLDPRRGRDYGSLKVACEHEVTRFLSDRTLITRPGLMVGPHDPTDRFGYWPQRMAAGGDVLAPGRPTDCVQLLDSRDHAEFVAGCIAAGIIGTFNTASRPVALGEVLADCTPLGTEVTTHWIDSALLRLNRIEPWIELPLWSGLKPPSEFTTASAERAGLQIRSLVQTAADALTWERHRSVPFPRSRQLSSQRERKLLQLYG